MQINLPSRFPVSETVQEADTATPPLGALSRTLAETPGEEEEEISHVLMLLVNFVVLHLLLCFN